MLMCVYGSSPCLEGTVQNIQIYSVLLVCALLSHLAYWGFGKESMLFNRVLLLERAGEHWDLIVCMVLLLACTCCAYVVGRLTQCSWVDLDVCLFKENLFSYWCRIRTPYHLVSLCTWESHEVFICTALTALGFWSSNEADIGRNVTWPSLDLR